MVVQIRIAHLLAAIAFLAAAVIGFSIGRATAPKPNATARAAAKGPPPEETEANMERAQMRVRAIVPAIENYYGDHSTYEGMTLDGLRERL